MAILNSTQITTSSETLEDIITFNTIKDIDHKLEFMFNSLIIIVQT